MKTSQKIKNAVIKEYIKSGYNLSLKQLAKIFKLHYSHISTILTEYLTPKKYEITRKSKAKA